MKDNILKYSLFLVILIVCVGCDQSTKIMAKEQLSYSQPIDYLDGFFKLVYAENTGAFLGLGDDLSPNLKYIFLVFIPTFFLFVFGAIYLRPSASYLQFVAISLIIAGGVGNMIDRITQGTVIDFMNIGIGNLRTGIFNFADVAVSTGLILFLFHIYKHKEDVPEEVTA